jgi:hypothetical protein
VAAAVLASVVGVMFVVMLVAVPWLGRRSTTTGPTPRRTLILVLVVAALVVGGGALNRVGARHAEERAVRLQASVVAALEAARAEGRDASVTLWNVAGDLDGAEDVHVNAGPDGPVLTAHVQALMATRCVVVIATSDGSRSGHGRRCTVPT